MITAELIHAAQERLRREVITDSRFNKKVSELHARVNYALPGQVFVLVGPPGASVTGITRALRERVRSETHPFNPFSIVEITARIPAGTKFQFKHFWKNGLAAVEAPIVGQRTRASESSRSITDFCVSAQFRGEHDYRSDFENGLARRSTRILSVIHAHAMLRNLQDHDLDLPLLIFHQLARSRIQFPQTVVLSGDYSLLRMFYRSAGADSWAKAIDVPTYNTDSPENAAEFLELLSGFEETLSDVMPGRLLVDHAGEIYERTLGTPGWVKRSLAEALLKLDKAKPGYLTWKSVKRCLPSKKALSTLSRSIDFGQEFFKEGPENDCSTSASNESTRETTQQPYRRVGERRPARDLIGLPND